MQVQLCEMDITKSKKLLRTGHTADCVKHNAKSRNYNGKSIYKDLLLCVES